jgi:hypothetical protein
MKKRLFLISSFFVACLTLAGCGGGQNASTSTPITSSGSSTPTTSNSSSTPVADGAVLAAAKTIAANATRDGMAVTANGLLSACGYNGNETLTKTRAFNLLYQAYKAGMPAMVGQRKYGAYVIAIPYTGVPKEAEDAVKFLSDHGILVKETDSTGADISVFNGDEDFTAGLNAYLDRFHAYCGTSLHDDFANTVNHDYLYANAATAQLTPTDSFEDSLVVSQSAINSWVSSHLENMASGAVKDNALLYKTSLENEDAKGSGVCAGAYTSYEVLTNPTDYQGLFSACASLFEKQGFDPLFSSIDMDGTITFLDHPFGEVNVPMKSDFVASDFTSGSASYTAFVSEANAVYKAVGFSNALADDYSKALGQFALSMGAAYKTDSSTYPADNKGYIFSAAEYGPQKFLFQSHLEAAGFSALTPVDLSSLDPSTAGNPLARFIADHDTSFHAYFDAMSDENFAGVKAQILYNQIKGYLPCNPVAAVTYLGQSANYLQDKTNLSKYFVQQVANSVISDYKETASYRNNVDVISKAITDLRAVLRTRIAGESWLSDAGKKAAFAKVDSIRTHILINNDNGAASDLSIPTFTSSLYTNLSAAKLAHWALVKSHADVNFYSARDLEYPFTANAYYLPSYNGIIILFGYLAAHNDFATLNQAELFSNLYLACGHELTHGFDTNGVNFDENGQANPTWWSQADHDAYTARVQSVINFYQDKEILPGFACNGTVVVSEACADCAGMRLVMDLAKAIPGFDYPAFFKDAAVLFMSTCTAAMYAFNFAPDSHPYGRVRSNCMVSGVDEFYSVFAITEGEGMYTALAKRPNVW